MPVLLLPRGLGSVPPAAMFPALTVEAQFTPAAWTDITKYVRIGGGGQISITRGSSRVESPVIRYDPGTMTVPLSNADRRFDPTNLAGPYVSGGQTQILPMIPVRVSAVFGSVTYRLFYGSTDSWTLTYSPPRDSVTTLAATDGFKQLAIRPRIAKSTFAGGGEDAGARVTRILDDASWDPTRRSIQTGNSTLQGTLLGSTPVAGTPAAVAAAGGTQTVNAQNAVSTSTALDELYLVADTEMGEMYVDGNGFLVFRNRNALFLDARSATPQAAFGDLDGGTYSAATYTSFYTGELPYASATLSYDYGTLWNGATIANQGGILQQAADAGSQLTYGPVIYDSENLIANSDWQSLGYAQQVVLYGRNPELRFSDITIQPQRAPANLFPQVLGRLIGDRITIKRRPPGGGAVISRDVFIRGISHTITSTTWDTTWILQDATSLPQPFIIGDAVNGVIGVSKIGF